MNLNFKKTMLLMSACTAIGVAFPVNASAESSTSVAMQQQQQKTVQGTVTDAAGPVIGATVMEKGTSNGTVTDFDGNFSLSVKPGATLVISYVGYTTQEVVVGNNTKFNVTLSEDNTALEEVVVVGYGVQKKKLVTGATVEVKGENIQKLNTTQALGALQSQTPGVNIQASSGQPGDGFKVTIRGAGTNGNTAPLYVIDGVSGGDINNINPADIERIDVLKDAASCAIYGSAAANGVILVTTKQGKAGKVQVSYDGYLGWSNIYRLPQMLTAGEYMKVMDLAKYNSGETPYNWADYFQGNEQLLADYQSGANPGTNWVEALRNKNAVTTSHSLNITGGSDLSKFSIGLGYQYQDGVFGGDYAKSDFRRFTLRLNSEHVIYRNSEGMDVVKVGENLYYGHRQKQGLDDGNQYANQLSTMLRANPLIPIYNNDGDFFGYDDLKNSGFFNYTSYATNPLASLVKNQSANNKSVNHNLDVVGYVEIQPIKGLIYRGQVSYKHNTWSWRNFLGTYHLNDQGDQRTNESATNQLGTSWSWGTTNTLNYKFDVANDHHFDVLVGTEYGESRPDFGFELSATATSAIISDFDHAYMTLMKNNTSATVSGLPSTDSRGMSYFGRLNYDYNETYMFSAIIRADGSSMFAPGERWGYFPSFSAGWVVSNEKFMEPLRGTLDFLKLRAGWGQNGNKNISAFQYEAAFAYDAFSNYSFGNTKDTPVRGASLSRLANEDLTWETSEQLNIGLDARFLGGRLGFNFDWYNKKTKDLLVAVPVSPTTGFSSQLKNAGTVENKGIEVALNWQDQIGKDFKYNIGYNIAYNKNEVTKVNSPQKYNNGGSDLLAQGTGYMARFEEGHPIGYFWGYKTDGVIQNEADLAAYTATLKDGDPANSHQGS
ncbi:MAG: SusC/RagA family TonB-linked outer membrane protein, partial [Prevotella sp.]|nr:SusC/RagA family TonB-linked outer membrane protein [Prevotella sp.]